MYVEHVMDLFPYFCALTAWEQFSMEHIMMEVEQRF